MRINKFIASVSNYSRRKSEDLIAEGKVKVNGNVVTNLASQIDDKKDVVELDGKVLTLPKLYYIKINKPKGYICSASDEKGRKIVLDLIKDCPVRLFSVGRLDYDSEGLLLLTNDGDFAQNVSHPSHEKNKVYIVNVEGKILESELAVMRSGVVLQDGTRMPSCKIKVLKYENNITRLEITIDEGQNRQIRRMFEAINRNILLLKRIAIGPVKLGGLSRGEYVDLSADEREGLMKL